MPLCIHTKFSCYLKLVLAIKSLLLLPYLNSHSMARPVFLRLDNMCKVHNKTYKTRNPCCKRSKLTDILGCSLESRIALFFCFSPFYKHTENSSGRLFLDTSPANRSFRYKSHSTLLIQNSCTFKTQLLVILDLKHSGCFEI